MTSLRRQPYQRWPEIGVREEFCHSKECKGDGRMVTALPVLESTVTVEMLVFLFNAITGTPAPSTRVQLGDGRSSDIDVGSLFVGVLRYAVFVSAHMLCPSLFLLDIAVLKYFMPNPYDSATAGVACRAV